MDVAKPRGAGVLRRIKQALTSKVMVVIALLGLTGGAFFAVSRASAAESNTDFSQVYQYYLLSNDSGHDNDSDGKDANDPGKAPGAQVSDSAQKTANDSGVTKYIKGAWGNGGNKGTFSYQDIVNGAADPHQARRFAEMMATLSGYNYISVQGHGMGEIMGLIGHFFAGLILVFCGFFLDVFTFLWNGVVQLISEYNVFTLLGSAFAASDSGQKLAQYMGLQPDDIKTIMSTLMLVFIAVILFTLVKMLRHGGTNIDGNDRRKFTGRLIGFISLPIVIVGACMMLQDAAGITGSNNSDGPDYANWLMDVKDWAFQQNFDTSAAGVNSVGNGVNADAANGKYVDTKFNPYTGDVTAAAAGGPAGKIGQKLFAKSSLNGSKFPNSAMALSYMGSQTFDARAYLQYIETNKIPQYFSNFKTDDKHTTDLYTFDKGVTSTGLTGGDYDKWADENSPMKKAEKDYVSGDKNKEKTYASKEKIWADRYIYGAKNDGTLKDYYKAGPSKEQIFSGAGSNSGNALTYESTFLALSTDFSVDGGSYMIDGPTYGAAASIPAFDSQRPTYYSYSMVGNPVFTFPAMLTEAFVTILVAMAVLTTMWSIGLVDMFVRPVRAWLKACSFGDIEYTEAELIYSLGVVGTILYIAMAPGIMRGFFRGATIMVGDLMTHTKASSGGAASNVFASEMAGSAYWLAFVFALAGNVMFIRNVAFRDKLVEMLSIPWNWARGKAEQLEDMVSDGSIARGAKGKADDVKRRRGAQAGLLSAMNNNDNAFTKGLNKLTGNKAGDLAEKGLEMMNRTGAYQPDGIKPDGVHTKKELTAEQLRRQGALRRMGKGLRGLHANQTNPAGNPSLIGKDFDKNGKDGVQADKLLNPDGTFDTNNPYASKELADQMKGYNADVYGDLSPEEIKRMQELEDKQARGEELTPDEQKELEGLQDKAAESNEMTKSADQMSDLENKGAEINNPLTAQEEATLDGLSNNAKQILGDNDYRTYNQLLAKDANGIPLTNKEKETIRTMEGKLKDKGMSSNAIHQMHQLTNRKLGPLSKKERIDLKKLQGLRRAETLRAPLSTKQLEVYQTLQRKVNAAIQAEMPPAQFDLMTKLENQTSPLTAGQAKQLTTLKQQASQIGMSHLSKPDQATFKRLDQQARPMMRAGQKAELAQLNKRVMRNLKGADRHQLKQASASIQAVQKNLQTRKDNLIYHAGTAQNLAQAKNERMQAAREANRIAKDNVGMVNRQIRQLQDTYSHFQSDPTEKGAADFAQQLVATRRAANVQQDHQLQRAINDMSQQAQHELNNFNFLSRDSVDMNQNGIPDSQEGYGRQQSLKSINKDMRRLNAALGDLRNGTTNSLHGNAPKK